MMRGGNMETMLTHMWMLWLIVMIVFLVLEAMEPGLTTIWFALGALAAMLAAIFIPNPVTELAVFVTVSLVALLLTRPLAKRLAEKRAEPTNADRLIGKVYCVTQTVNENDGLLEIGDVSWRVRCRAADGPLEAGKQVIIERIEGNLLWVRRK